MVPTRLREVCSSCYSTILPLALLGACLKTILCTLYRTNPYLFCKPPAITSSHGLCAASAIFVSISSCRPPNEINPSHELSRCLTLLACLGVHSYITSTKCCGFYDTPLVCIWELIKSLYFSCLLWFCIYAQSHISYSVFETFEANAA